MTVVFWGGTRHNIIIKNERKLFYGIYPELFQVPEVAQSDHRVQCDFDRAAVYSVRIYCNSPQTSADVICYVAGILLLASGIAAVVSYLASGRLFGSYALVSGIVLLVCGVFCLLRPEVIQGLLTVIFGVFLVIDGMVTLQDGIDCARAKLGGWWVLASLAVITIALGCVILFGKFDSIMLLAGISLIVDGVFDLIATLAFSKRVREARQKLHMYMGGPIIDSEKVDD